MSAKKHSQVQAARKKKRDSRKKRNKDNHSDNASIAQTERFDIKDIISNGGIAINQDGFTHFDYYQIDELLNNQCLNSSSVKNYATAVFFDLTFKMGFHLKFDFDYVEFLLECSNKVKAESHLYDCICLFQTVSGRKIMDAIYSHPVEARAALIAKFFNHHSVYQQYDTSKNIEIDMSEVYKATALGHPFVITMSNGKMLSLSEEEYQKVITIGGKKCELAAYLDELWAERHIYKPQQ